MVELFSDQVRLLTLISEKKKAVKIITHLGPGSAGVPACPRRARPWSGAQLFTKQGRECNSLGYVSCGQAATPALPGPRSL